MLLIDQVYSEIFSKSLGYYSKIQSLFSQILIEILRLISPKKKENIPYLSVQMMIEEVL